MWPNTLRIYSLNLNQNLKILSAKKFCFCCCTITNPKTLMLFFIAVLLLKPINQQHSKQQQRSHQQSLTVSSSQIKTDIKSRSSWSQKLWAWHRWASKSFLMEKRFSMNFRACLTRRKESEGQRNRRSDTDIELMFIRISLSLLGQFVFWTNYSLK